MIKSSALCMIALVFGNTEKAACLLNRFGIPVGSEEEEKAAKMAESLEMAEVSVIAAAYPQFYGVLEAAIESPDNQYSEMMAKEARDVKKQWFLIEILLDILRRQADWKDAEDVAAYLKAQGLKMSKTRSEFHTYARMNKLTRIQTRGRYLYPPMSWMLFVYDFEAGMVKTGKEQSKQMKNASFLKENFFKNLPDVIELFKIRYPQYAINRDDVLLSANRAKIRFIHAGGTVYFDHDGTEKLIGFLAATKEGEKQQNQLREIMLFQQEFIASLPPEIRQDYEEKFWERFSHE